MDFTVKYSAAHKKICVCVGEKKFFYAFNPAYLKSSTSAESLSGYIHSDIAPLIHRDMDDEWPGIADRVIAAIENQLLRTLEIFKKNCQNRDS